MLGVVLCCVVLALEKEKKRKTVRRDIDGNICTDACRGGRGGALNTSNSFKVCLPARLHLHIQRVRRASPANQQPLSTRQTHPDGNSKEGNSLLCFIVLICFIPPPPAHQPVLLLTCQARVHTCTLAELIRANSLGGRLADEGRDS